MTTVDQWAESYRSGTDGELKAAIKTFYNMKAWHELHIALWVWLSLCGEREKAEWFETFDAPEVKRHCFACEEAEELRENFLCHYCPLTNSSSIDCLDGLYDQWCGAESLERKERLARKIAEMEWHGQK